MSSSGQLERRIGTARLWTAFGLFLACGAAFLGLLIMLASGFESRWEQVQVGMGEQDVEALLGAPDRRRRPFATDFPDWDLLLDGLGVGYDRWVYDRPGRDGRRIRHIVFFRSGTVVATSVEPDWTHRG